MSKEVIRNLYVTQTSKERKLVNVMRATEVAMIGVCAALYAVIGRLTDFGFTVGGVAFWPAAVIPAIFAVLFGPLIGGLGGGIGIFIRDMLFHGDPFLSLSAGVTANFALFFLIGYITRRKVDLKKIGVSVLIGSAILVIGLLLPTVLLPSESAAFFGLSSLDSAVLLLVTIVASILMLVVVAKFWPEWSSYGVGSVIGLGVGSAIIAVVVWTYSQLYFSPTGYFTTAIPLQFIPIIFVWTFASEIPFIMVLGPPVVKACYRAFPFLMPAKKEADSRR